MVFADPEYVQAHLIRQFNLFQQIAHALHRTDRDTRGGIGSCLNKTIDADLHLPVWMPSPREGFGESAATLLSPMSSITEGAVNGPVRVWLRAEGLAVVVLSLILYQYSLRSWWLFVGLLLTPDLSMLPYLVNPRLGAWSYNTVHSYLLPFGLAALAIATQKPAIFPYLYIWTAHIGLDRMLGYGLKYPSGFGSTHLGVRRGRASLPESIIRAKSNRQ